MPNLGSGVDQHVNVSALPAWVFTPTPNVPSACLRLYNEGTAPVYVGSSSVTPYNGFQLLPGNRPLELGNAKQTVYACCGVTAGTTSTTVNAYATAGSSVLTVGSGATNYAAGTTIIVGNASGQEVLVVTGTAATSITVSTTTLYDHGAGATVYTAVVAPAQLRVTAGVV